MKVIFPIALVEAWCLGNMLGWASPEPLGPFNWHIFLGPWVYIRWTARR